MKEVDMKMIIRTAILCLIMSSSSLAAQELLLYGGTGHDRFLGCFNCDEYDSSSICNEYGKGSAYDSRSIFNEYGTFGNEYATQSPWNEYSTSNDVPVLVDRNGGFYGYFTINEYRSDAVNFASDLADVYDAADGELEVVQKILCKMIHD